MGSPNQRQLVPRRHKRPAMTLAFGTSILTLILLQVALSFRTRVTVGSDLQGAGYIKLGLDDIPEGLLFPQIGGNACASAHRHLYRSHTQDVAVTYGVKTTDAPAGPQFRQLVAMLQSLLYHRSCCIAVHVMADPSTVTFLRQTFRLEQHECATLHIYPLPAEEEVRAVVPSTVKWGGKWRSWAKLWWPRLMPAHVKQVTTRTGLPMICCTMSVD